jgi:hypothetical protein
MTAKAIRIAAESADFETLASLGAPVIVEGVARNMKAFTQWTDDYLAEVLSVARAVVRFDDGRLGRLPFEAFLAYLRSPSQFRTSSGAMYLTDCYIRPCFGDSWREALACDAPFPLNRPGNYAEWISLYAGPAGTMTRWHQDIFSTHTWLAQLRGEKAWTLCAPDSEFYKGELVCAVQAVEATLRPGDLIYVPPNWWHTVTNRSATLSVSGNFCTFAHARKSLEEALSSTSSQREIWIATWTAILSLAEPGDI